MDSTDKKDKNISDNKTWRQIWTFVGVVATSIILSQTFRLVPTGYTGIKVTFGRVTLNPVDEGLTLHNPLKIYYIEKVDKRLQKITNDCSAFSKELQVIHVKLSMLYTLNNEFVPYMYQQLGNRNQLNDKILQPAIQEGVKQITPKYTATECVTKRKIIKNEIVDAIVNITLDALTEKQLNGLITISNIALENYLFTNHFTDMVDSKVKAVQNTLKAEEDAKINITGAEMFAGKTMREAQAQAYKINMTSTANATTIIKKAEALASSLGGDLIDIRKASIWDGKLPKYFGGKAITLFDSGYFKNVDNGGHGKSSILDVSSVPNLSVDQMYKNSNS